jgi:hypothetical protein
MGELAAAEEAKWRDLMHRLYNDPDAELEP